MHKFLFGNRRKNISSYNPFGSQKNMKPGIITKIKNKIQGLFQPTINSQSLIQRIQSFDDKNLEQELSNQFKNNLVLIDRIIPNKDDIIILKRKSICPFEQYLKEEMDSDKKISKETQTDMSSKPNDSQIKTSNVKKQKKFKKEHSKIYKSRKMEENPKQLEFNQNKQNFKQNLNQKYEKQSEYQFNYSNKRLKQFDSFTESSIPIKQKGETSDYLSPVKILENQSIIQKDDNNNLKCDSFLKELKVSSSSAQSPSNNNHFKDELNKNNKFSSSTGSNSKGEGNETILSFKNVYFQQEPQENKKDIDQNKKPLIIQQNQEQEFENNQKSNETYIQNLNQVNNIGLNQNQFDFQQENNMIIKKENNNNLKDKDIKQENQQIQTIDVIEKQIKGNKQQEAENNEQNNIQNSSILDSNSNNKQFHAVKQCHIETNTNIQLQNQISQQQDINNEQQLENQQFLNQNLLSQNEQQDYLSEKTSKFQNSLPQQNNDIQKNILQTSFLNNQNKQTVDKSIKEQNPFLTQSSNISSDQISLYFQAFSTSNQNKQCQPQNQNQPIIDLFKISTQQPQQIINNKPQDKQNTQNLLQNSINFGNAKILQYSTNKQMEIIEQAPTQINQIIQGKQQDFEIAQLNYQQQPNQQNNLFQQQQNYPQQLIQQQSFQFQNLFSQQQQTSNQISSLNLFQTNTYQQQQNDINNKPLFLKNDVLSLFQDTKKSDRDIFQTPQYQQTSQSLNNSFNKVKKKQRINNC
ncbi:unnamed protein product [Paramecium primaurelia]|uniref:Uncharacterized protein n=1 Tax=Paramecium primaurelia TaxID=5886 RepID=A0A8S1KUS5_PARPR|nr:unnamed protein product [Paramecium primaurelia]